MKKRIVVGASGASGMPVLMKCLEFIRESGMYESFLILSESAGITFGQEMRIPVSEAEKLADHVLCQEDIGAGPASGSFRTEGMLIVPCSMKTIAGIHAGYAENLIRCDHKGAEDAGAGGQRDAAQSDPSSQSPRAFHDTGRPDHPADDDILSYAGEH